jgi:PAS domain-containing protein
VVKDSSITVLDASIKMAFRLHEAYQNLKNQKIEIELDEKKLEIFEKRYRILFESAKDGILILNADNGMIVDVNHYLIAMLDYTKEEFLITYIWDISAFKILIIQNYIKHYRIKIMYDTIIPLETKMDKNPVEFIVCLLVDTESYSMQYP